jgi:hypothetical protein
MKSHLYNHRNQQMIKHFRFKIKDIVISNLEFN